MPHKTAAVSTLVLCIPYNHSPRHFMQSHIRKVRACLAVTCHLHVWQNGRDILRATAVTRGWNGYWNNSRQHRKLTTGNKILPPLLDGLEPATFQSRVRRSNHWAIPAPHPLSYPRPPVFFFFFFPWMPTIMLMIILALLVVFASPHFTSGHMSLKLNCCTVSGSICLSL